jgi:extradiol dioxygenase family protein
MKRSVSFYRDVLGLSLKCESPGWTEFATHGRPLVLHASDASNSEKDNPLRASRVDPLAHCTQGRVALVRRLSSSDQLSTTMTRAGVESGLLVLIMKNRRPSAATS